MSQTLGVVDVPFVRTSEARTLRETLPGRRFAGVSLLEWVAQRITDVQGIESVVVLLGPEHAELETLAPPGSETLISQRPDGLGRLAELCDAHRPDAIVRVCVDAPFVDPQLIDQLISTAAGGGCDYATYCSRDGLSAIQAELGMVAEWTTADAVMQANQSVGDLASRIGCTRAIWSRPDLFRLRFLPLPSALDREDLRLTVTCEEDWEQVHQIYEALGRDELDWQRIAGLLQDQPEMRRRMAGKRALATVPKNC